MKLNAGTITYAIFIAFLIFGICSTFILFGFFQRKIIHKNEDELSILIELQSAIELGLSRDFEFGLDEEIDIQLFPNKNSHELILSNESWGLFDLITAKIEKNSIFHNKIALIGSREFNYSSTALYLADRNSPLSIAGNTVIIGPCFLPKSGVKKTFIEGVSFNGVIFRQDFNQQSAREIPPVDYVRLKKIVDYLNPQFIDSLIDERILEKEYQFNPWQHKTAVFQSNSKIVLNSHSLEGRIIIQSFESITVENSHLDGIILIAPKVYIRNQRKGNFQVIATDSILVGKGSSLQYPSSLTIIDLDKKASFQPAIIIKENSIIEGEVLMNSTYSKRLNQLYLSIESNSSITGRAYIKGLVSLKGKIYGSLFCEGFILRNNHSNYTNHILNGRIDLNGLPSNYLSSTINQSTDKKIIKWLN